MKRAIEGYGLADSYEPVGRRFDSFRAHHFVSISSFFCDLLGGIVLSRINNGIYLFVARFNEFPLEIRVVLLTVLLLVVVGLGVYLGAFSIGNPGNHIPRGWRHSF
jgi:hypothetical protein